MTTYTIYYQTGAGDWCEEYERFEWAMYRAGRIYEQGGYIVAVADDRLITEYDQQALLDWLEEHPEPEPGEPEDIEPTYRTWRGREWHLL